MGNGHTGIEAITSTQESENRNSSKHPRGPPMTCRVDVVFAGDRLYRREGRSLKVVS
jgi:hypothetical protein